MSYARERREILAGFGWENVTKKTALKTQDIDGIILKWVLKKCDKVRIGLI
jgi:hypothetical protein